MNEQVNIILIANGAGELAAYVKPLAQEIFTKIPRANIILVLSPCQYATGNEASYAQGLGTISQIVDAESFKRWLLLGKAPARLNLGTKGIIIYLGGDILYAALLSKKTKLPAIAYLGGHVGWTKLFKRFFVANDYDYRRFIKKVPAEKLINSGSLMVDSVAQSISNSNEKKLRLCQKLMLDPKKPIIAFFPGSRDFSLDYLVPFYAKVIDSLKSQNSNLQMVMSHSPFVNKAKIEKYLSKANLKITLTEDADSIADLTVTIPGTNTGQLAAQGMPMVVVFPLDKPDNIPLEGVADWIGRIPFLGVSFKHLVAAYVNATTKYFALPNQLSNSLIVTELRGKIDPKDVAFQVLALLSDSLRRSEMSLKLKKSMGTAGAAGKIVGEVIKELALGDKA